MDTVLLVAGQVVAQALIWPAVVALVVEVVRRRRTSPRLWIPATGIAALLVSFSFQVNWRVVDGEITSMDPAAAWPGALTTIATPLILSTFPDGRFVPGWSIVPVAAWAALAVAYAATDGAIGQEVWWTPLAATQALFLLAAVHRYRRRLSTTERERVRWALLGAVLGIGSMTVLVVIVAATGRSNIAELGALVTALADVLPLLIPLGCVVGLLWPRLADVDAVLRIVLIGALVGAGLAGATALLTWVAPFLGVGPAAMVWIAALAAGGLGIPLLRGARRLADWIVYRNRPDPSATVAALGARLDAQPDARRVPETIVELARESLGLVAVELAGEGLGSVAVGPPRRAQIEVPINYQGERVAVLRVAPRAGESDLTARDRDVLAALAQQAAPALHGTRTVEELIEARSRVVRAREEERKQLRRDLHDDLSPTLAGLGLTAAGIAGMARAGRDGIAEVADALLADIQVAMGRTREIAYGLRPPVLDDLGLVAAIRDRTRSAHGDPLAIDVRGGDLHLPAAVELAALRIVQEAVQNVRKHSGARACRIELQVDGDDLDVRVSDDGRGIPRVPRSGIGLRSIHERADELGGRAWISPGRDGGTVVRVLLPTGARATGAAS